MTNDGAVRCGMTMGALAFAVTGGARLAVVGVLVGYRFYERIFG